MVRSNPAFMKNRLQYLYSISVFIGVLCTAYLMMSSEGNKFTSNRTVQGPYLRTEAGIDPALSSLFEVEEVLESLPQEDLKAQKRVPTQATPVKKPAPRLDSFEAN